MNLSKRMETVVSLVPPESSRIADIGCDHAYVSIALVSRNLAKKVIAMDVRKGPLEIATKNVNEAGLHNVIDLRLSDGLEKLESGEVDTVIIAGMGGLLIKGILERGHSILFSKETNNASPTLILQPQSEIDKVREYLLSVGYSIFKEEMLEEDGKYYTVLCAKTEKCDSQDCMSFDAIEQYDEADFFYGRYNLLHKNDTLFRYLQSEKENLNKIYKGLALRVEKSQKNEQVISEKTLARKNELQKELLRNEKGLDWFEK